jgi:carbamoyl-phosphate synthase small subunit
MDATTGIWTHFYWVFISSIPFPATIKLETFMSLDTKHARLILEDGTEFIGESFGYQQSCAGEVVFATGMVGYPESFTDPSYKGQILTLTFPLIGNYGMPEEKKMNGILQHYESDKAQISGVIVENYSHHYHHWNAQTSLAQWLYNQEIPAISGIDTRALTKRLREKGTMLGKIIIDKSDLGFYDPNKENLVEKVSIQKPIVYGKGTKTVLLIDCGCKNNIIRELLKRKVKVIRVPWNYPIWDEKFDGVLISNGPGDPKMCQTTINGISKIFDKNVPAFGICMGNQLLALAAGADTVKMKYGHRSQNQPVMDLTNNKCYITTQNHGFMVKQNSIPKSWKIYYKNLNDDTVEGIMHKSGRFFSVQFHPEAYPGPVDTAFLFDQFIGIL